MATDHEPGPPLARAVAAVIDEDKRELEPSSLLQKGPTARDGGIGNIVRHAVPNLVATEKEQHTARMIRRQHHGLELPPSVGIPDLERTDGKRARHSSALRFGPRAGPRAKEPRLVETNGCAACREECHEGEQAATGWPRRCAADPNGMGQRRHLQASAVPRLDAAAGPRRGQPAIAPATSQGGLTLPPSPRPLPVWNSSGSGVPPARP